MKNPSPQLSFRPGAVVKAVAGLALLSVLAACQQNPVVGAPQPVNPRLGGMNPGETYTVVNCPNLQGTVCTINVVAVAPPAGGDQCTVAMDGAVSLPKTLTTLRWQLQASDATHEYRFRGAGPADPPGYGVRLIDNLMYVPPPTGSASAPMQPIWVQQQQLPELVQFERIVRAWPPRISAYDVYLEYRLKGARDWTACNTWDPVVINRD
jgi:hypothetical protein